ncbi:MAG: hypothetical protein ACKPCM_10885, partial [Pseudanabaena sp.]
KDKVSNKDFNLYTKEIFANKKVAYITKRGEVFSNQLSKQLNSAIESDTLLRFWYATFYEQPEIAKNSVYEVMEVVFDATNNYLHPLHRLFNGEKDSPIYQQLIYAYTIYRYVQTKKESQRETKEYIGHATELIAYGIYKYLENDLKSIDNPESIETAYQFVLSLIDQSINEQIALYNIQNKSFSYSGYFRKAKCRFVYNLKASIVEDDSIIDKLLSQR